MGFFWAFFGLPDYTHTLNRIERRLNMAVTQADFDTLLGTIKPPIDNLVTVVTALGVSLAAFIASGQNQGVDLTAEAATVTGDLTELQGAVTQLAAVAATIPAPAPPPAKPAGA